MGRLLRLLVAACLVGSGFATAATPSRSSHGSSVPGMRGADVSWPNCPKGEGIPSRRSEGQPMPKGSARFVVVGLTNGPGFYPNPCLASQVAWVAANRRRLAAYAMTTYPSRHQFRTYASSGPYTGHGKRAHLKNVGYAEAVFNVRTMTDIGMSVPMVWVDVEPYSVAPWSDHRRWNRAVITGAIRAYRDQALDVGIYTYANGWRAVVGGWRLTAYPTWAAAGHTGPRHARSMCTTGPSGGSTWIAQWVGTHRDFDLACPGTHPRREGVMFSGP